MSSPGSPARIPLYHGPTGALADFTAVSLLWVSHEGEEHAVFKGVTCVDARYKLTRLAPVPILRESMIFELRHPWTHAGYMGMAATLSGYRLLAMPERIRTLLLKATRIRGYEAVDEERLLVPSTSRLAQPERIRGSQSLEDDPDARFYVEQNPQSDRFYMLVWAPLDLENITRGVAQMVRRHVWKGGGLAS
jgi:hypothetical protein